MTLKDAVEGKVYVIDTIINIDDELETFLFSLGCYGGERVIVTTQLRNGCIISVKNSRYHVDTPLAKAITIYESEGDAV